MGQAKKKRARLAAHPFQRIFSVGCIMSAALGNMSKLCCAHLHDI